MSEPVEFITALELEFNSSTLVLVVKPASMGALLKVLGTARPIADEVMGLPEAMLQRLKAGTPDTADIAWLYELLADRGDLAIDLVSILTGAKRELVEQVLPDRFVYLFALVVQVNADFFARAPGVFKAAMARMQGAAEQLGQKPSLKPSTP